MIVIRQLPEVDVRRMYPSLFFESFKQAFDGTYPPVVLLAEYDAEILGWVSGYSMNKDTFYLQRTGKRPRFIGNKRAPYYLQQIFKFLKSKLGYKYVNAYIENTNNPAIVSALKGGFIINGVRVSRKPVRTMLSITRKL